MSSPCPISCFISGAFLVGMAYFYYMADKSQTVKEYRTRLSSDLKQRYDKITHERMTISIQGYVLGLLLSLLIIYYNIQLKDAKLSTWMMVCIVLSTSFVVNYFYYIIHPKSDWMLNHMHTPSETHAWLKMYRELQVNYHLGLVLGILAVGILGFAFRI